MALLRRFERPLFVIFFGILLWGGHLKYDDSRVLSGDELRYMRYAVSLHEHGVFALASRDIQKAPLPGNANAPLYPVLLAGMMILDNAFAQSLACQINSSESGSDCTRHFEVFMVVQAGLALLSLFLIYVIVIRYTKNHVMAWLAALLALGSGIFAEFSSLFMTEILILPVFVALTLFCLLFYQDKRLRWVCAIAATLAALTLIRPSYLYLFYGFSAFFMTVFIIRREKKTAIAAGVFIAIFVLAVSPWAIRNKIHFDSFALTSGGYAEAILVQRVNYNQMSWPEVGVAMIYWLPDFGDSLVEKIFPPPLYEKLGWSEGSYYAQGYSVRIDDLTQALGGRDKVLKYLIEEEVLTPKHFAVSVPLAVRGVFIAKYWGLAGFIAFIALLIQTLRRGDYSLLAVGLPVFYMVAFHAGLSVSIPRYNLPLITLYALAMAWYINIYGYRFVSKIRPA